MPIAPGKPLSLGDLDAQFRAKHVEVYGYDLEQHSIEMVNLRIVARSAVWQSSQLSPPVHDERLTRRHRKIRGAGGDAIDVPVVPRSSLKRGETLNGPAIIEDLGATVRILDGQRVHVMASGVLEIEVGHGRR